ncbi:MAG TPA: amidase [Candidatus Latescibacteria bacterium]|nr:amidase [Candidatus Latescibacterota bacterium]
MKYQLPTAEDLMDLASANRLSLSEEELAAFQALMPGLFENYEMLERTARLEEPGKYPERVPGYRPSREEDPLNAILDRIDLRGADSGKLAGKRFGLKDNISVAGFPMTCGSNLLDGYVPDADATIVTRLLDAGAQIVAKLNLDDLALSGGGDTSAFGAVLNPHDPEFLTGGSSGGSAAALYYDDIDITIGGDQGGSIRIPASWCGVVGLKPTHGLVPYTGIAGLDNTFDHTGPMARTVEDVALTLEVIAGKDPLDPRQGVVPVQAYTESLGWGVDGLRIGAVAEGFGLESSEPDVDVAVRQGLEVFGELGAQVSEVSIPAHSDAGGVAWGLIVEGTTAILQSNGMGHHWEGLYPVGFAEALGESRRSGSDHLPPAAKLLMLIGSYVSDRYHGRPYAIAQNLRRPLRASYDRALEQFDILAMPTTPMKAHRYVPDIGVEGLLEHGFSMGENTAPFNMTGHPAISIPCAKSAGLPVGLMLVGKRFDDATILTAASAFEQQVDWETHP